MLFIALDLSSILYKCILGRYNKHCDRALLENQFRYTFQSRTHDEKMICVIYGFNQTYKAVRKAGCKATPTNGVAVSTIPTPTTTTNIIHDLCFKCMTTIAMSGCCTSMGCSLYPLSYHSRTLNESTVLSYRRTIS